MSTDDYYREQQRREEEDRRRREEDERRCREDEERRRQEEQRREDDARRRREDEERRKRDEDDRRRRDEDCRREESARLKKKQEEEEKEAARKEAARQERIRTEENAVQWSASMLISKFRSHRWNLETLWDNASPKNRERISDMISLCDSSMASIYGAKTDWQVNAENTAESQVRNFLYAYGLGSPKKETDPDNAPAAKEVPSPVNFTATTSTRPARASKPKKALEDMTTEERLADFWSTERLIEKIGIDAYNKLQAESAALSEKWMKIAKALKGPDEPKIGEIKPEAKGESLNGRSDEKEKDSKELWRTGLMYEEGRGVEQSYVQAVKFYKVSADQNNADGQCALGRMYEFGIGMGEADEEAAADLYWRAGKQGHAEAQWRLGVMNEEGRGVEQSDKRALICYNLAADQNLADGQCALGRMYELGRGMEKPDFKNAADLYRRAAKQGHAEAQWRLGAMYEKGRGVEQSDEAALKWYKASASQEDADGQCALGRMYEMGAGMDDRDRKAAANLFQRASDQGHAEASWRLGDMYQDSMVPGQINIDDYDRYEQASTFYYRSAIQGNPEGEFRLARVCEFLAGRDDEAYSLEQIEDCEKEAEKWYRLAAEHGHPEAQFRRGDQYEHGDGENISPRDAMKWYRRAAEQGHAESQWRLGLIYEYGRGVKISMTEAKLWYRRAAEQDHVKAVDKLETGRDDEPF